MKRSHRAFAFLALNVAICAYNAAPLFTGNGHMQLINVVVAALAGYLSCRLAVAIGRREARRARKVYRRRAARLHDWLGLDD